MPTFHPNRALPVWRYGLLSILLGAAHVAQAVAPEPIIPMAGDNPVILQPFSEFTTMDGHLWRKISRDAPLWAQRGISVMWLPPVSKGLRGPADMGYAVYDLYDLGEFHQKGEGRTRWGTRAELEQAVQALHQQGIQAWVDVVLNHRMGADATETVSVVKVNARDRRKVMSDPYPAKVWTKFDFPGREIGDNQLAYSNFRWTAEHFNGADRDANVACDERCPILRWANKQWNQGVGRESGNDDFLMGVNVDLEHPAVKRELIRWGIWLVQSVKIDGFRLDAVKHTPSDFWKDWLLNVREQARKPLPAAIEYWSGDGQRVQGYVRRMASPNTYAFDMPLQARLHTISEASGYYDLRNLFLDTVLHRMASQTITVVDNHDTLNANSNSMRVGENFKAQAYAITLLRQGGIPSVYIADYEGIPGQVQSWKPVLDKLLVVRKHLAYGEQLDAWDDPDWVGWTRTGDSKHPGGFAVVLTDRTGEQGSKYLKISSKYAGQCYANLLAPKDPHICLDPSGGATFSAGAAGLAVWVPSANEAWFLQEAERPNLKKP